MSDLAKCKGHRCPIKEHCKRFNSIASDVQSWGDFRYDSETGCDYFMEERE